jgi:hypothetical protein
LLRDLPASEVSVAASHGLQCCAVRARKYEVRLSNITYKQVFSAIGVALSNQDERIDVRSRPPTLHDP